MLKKIIQNFIKPKSSSTFVEGFRLAIINGIILLLIGGLISVILYVFMALNRLGSPLPPPIGLVLLVFCIPYYIFHYKYGKTFGSILIKKYFLKGVLIGVVGQFPALLLRTFLINIGQSPNLAQNELIRVLLIFLSIFVIVLPIITALGSLENKSASR